MPLRSKSLSRESGSALDLLIPNLPGLEALRAITTVGSEVRTFFSAPPSTPGRCLKRYNWGHGKWS
jgi:hypothetical protein